MIKKAAYSNSHYKFTVLFFKKKLKDTMQFPSNCWVVGWFLVEQADLKPGIRNKDS